MSTSIITASAASGRRLTARSFQCCSSPTFPREPKWDESNPKAALYVEAWKKLHGR